MAREGFYLPRVFHEVVANLKKLLRAERPKRLVIDGDLKHSFVPEWREKEELRAFVEEVSPMVEEIVLVRGGNHDVGTLWLRELGVEVVDELELKGWKLVHGHKLVEGGALHNRPRASRDKAQGRGWGHCQGSGLPDG